MMGDRWPTRSAIGYDDRATTSPAMTEAAPAPTIPVEVERSQLAEDILRASAAIKQWEIFAKAKKVRLSELHKVGTVPTTFLEHGYNFTLRDGREGHDIDDEGKEQQKRLLEQLVEEGHAEPKTGDPYWDTRKAAKPKAPKKGKARTPVLRNQESLDDEDYAIFEGKA